MPPARPVRYTVVCAYCSGDFPARRSDARYCCPACRKAASRARAGGALPGSRKAAKGRAAPRMTAKLRREAHARARAGVKPTARQMVMIAPVGGDDENA